MPRNHESGNYIKQLHPDPIFLTPFSPGVEVGPASKVYSGEIWAGVGPEYLLGYNYRAPLDTQGAAGIIQSWYNKSGGNKIDAWRDANDNLSGHNACAIWKGSVVNFYYYFHKTNRGLFNTYEWKSVSSLDW